MVEIKEYFIDKTTGLLSFKEFESDMNEFSRNDELYEQFLGKQFCYDKR